MKVVGALTDWAILIGVVGGVFCCLIPLIGCIYHNKTQFDERRSAALAGRQAKADERLMRKFPHLNPNRNIEREVEMAHQKSLTRTSSSNNCRRDEEAGQGSDEEVSAPRSPNNSNRPSQLSLSRKGSNLGNNNNASGRDLHRSLSRTNSTLNSPSNKERDRDRERERVANNEEESKSSKVCDYFVTHLFFDVLLLYYTTMFYTCVFMLLLHLQLHSDV
jgi:hypothetical protein